MVKNYLKVLAVVVVAAILFFGGRASVSNTTFGDAYTSFPNGLTVGGGTYAETPAFVLTGNASTTGTTTASGGLQIGSSGTPINQFLFGSCTLGTLGPSSIDASQAASTTKIYDCPFTGVRPGDTIFATFSTSTAQVAGWAIASAKASTTNNYVEIGITNWTGASVVPSTQSVGSSTRIQVLR